jgi:multiple sugar transport system ATP-binding protein
MIKTNLAADAVSCTDCVEGFVGEDLQKTWKRVFHPFALPPFDDRLRFGQSITRMLLLAANSVNAKARAPGAFVSRMRRVRADVVRARRLESFPIACAARNAARLSRYSYGQGQKAGAAIRGRGRMAKVELRHLWKRFGDVVAVEDFSLNTSDGEFIVFVGPSGCGKTTTMRIVAGLETASEGEVLFDDKDVSDALPRDRDIAMVFQNYALFPHLNVFSNMAFGMRLRKVDKAEIEQRVRRAAQILGIEELLQRRPKELSGGQRQRVALGRAIVREPRVFLMDEPLSNLDAALRMEMRAEIIKLQERLGVTTFYVTHDQVEALSMGDRIVVMRRGRIQQVGSPTELYEQPQNIYVASFIGSPPMNFLQGNAQGDSIVLTAEGTTLSLSGASRVALAQASSEEITVGVRPEHIVLSDRPAEAGKFSIVGTVDTVEPLGHTTLVRAKMRSEQRLNALLTNKVRLSEGATVHATFGPDQLYLFDRKSERALLGISQ